MESKRIGSLVPGHRRLTRSPACAAVLVNRSTYFRDHVDLQVHRIADLCLTQVRVRQRHWG